MPSELSDEQWKRVRELWRAPRNATADEIKAAMPDIPFTSSTLRDKMRLRGMEPNTKRAHNGTSKLSLPPNSNRAGA